MSDDQGEKSIDLVQVAERSFSIGTDLLELELARVDFAAGLLKSNQQATVRVAIVRGELNEAIRLVELARRALSRAGKLKGRA